MGGHPESPLTSEQVVDVLTESTLVLMEGNARGFGIALHRHTVLGFPVGATP